MRNLLLVSFALLGMFGCAGSVEDTAESSSHPNIVVILADDQGWGDLSIHGNGNLSTPNIDSLGNDGALFEHFYVCAVCAPTRAEFLTGRYYARGGVRGVSRGEERLNLDEHTIAQTFGAAGYATGAFGKWHNGTQHPYHPNARGFDEFYGFTEGHWGQYFDYELDHNGELVQGKGFAVDDFTNHAIDFIEEHKDGPFFAYLPYNTPHSPMQVPDEYWARFEDKELGQIHRDPKREDIPKTRAALAMVENIDWNVGRVLAKLDELGIADNTIVLYFSDNGPNSYRWNADMKGRKGTIDEGGLRSPLLVRWPGQIPAGRRVTQIAGAIDLLPTLADLTGIEVQAEKPIDGKSLKPLLMGSSDSWAERQLLSLRRNQVSVRNQRFRLDAEGQLFDIAADPGQRADVAADHPEVTAELTALAEQFAADVLPGVGPDDRPYPVGHAPLTLLPARDGQPHGGIERSARAPNCSFFTNWTSLDDEMTWPVDIAADGEYEALIYYTASASDVGSTVQLTVGEASAEAKVVEAFDPPLVGESDDRVPRRGESYVKDFRPLSLGIMSLQAGPAPLALRATEIAGQQVADIRYVAFRKK